MAAGFEFNGTDVNIALADAAGYDVSPDGDSFTLSFWINPDTRTAREALFERTGWFNVYIEPDGEITVQFGDGSTRRFGHVQDNEKTHVMFSLRNAEALASGTADTNVATLLIDLDANWYTNGVTDSNPEEGDYLVYNRTDRTYDYGRAIDDYAFTASDSTVDADNDTISAPSHSYVDGCPVLVKGADVPAGTADDGTVYYVGDVDGDNIYLYDTAANAVTNDGSTGLIDLTDVGSGTVTLRAREDAIQLDSDLCPDGNEVVYIFENGTWVADFRAWINGVRQEVDETINHFNTPADSAQVITVGSTTAGAEWYDGKMNEVAIWTPGFATDEIAAALYNDGTELEAFEDYDGSMTLYGHWSFDETGAATAVDNDEGTAGRDGTASENTDGITTTTLDTTDYNEASGVLAFTAAATLTGQYIIKRMEWDGSATAADDLVVRDSNDEDIWVVNNKVANDRGVIEFPDGLQVDGLKVVTIDAGTLYVYI